MAIASEYLVPTDVIDVLLGQHREIRQAVGRVCAAPDRHRDQAVRAMAEIIETHEDVEARLLHPVAERGLPDGPAVAHARVVEEDQADELLSELLTLRAVHRRFPAVFGEFRAILLNHLWHEEHEEFVALRAWLPAEHLVELGDQAREDRLWL